MLILGIDIGTTKVAGVLLELPGNKILKTISLDHSADIKSSNPWEQTQDPDKIIEKTEIIIEKLKDFSPEKPDALGISCQMHGCVYVGKNGKPLGPLYTWLDNRAAMPVNGEDETILERIERKTGKSVFSGYGIATHYYNYKTDRFLLQAAIQW